MIGGLALLFALWCTWWGAQQPKEDMTSWNQLKADLKADRERKES
jgi:hypothetical protein